MHNYYIVLNARKWSGKKVGKTSGHKHWTKYLKYQWPSKARKISFIPWGIHNVNVAQIKIQILSLQY